MYLAIGLHCEDDGVLFSQQVESDTAQHVCEELMKKAEIDQPPDQILLIKDLAVVEHWFIEKDYN
jgi:hypothetical protein